MLPPIIQQETPEFHFVGSDRGGFVAEKYCTMMIFYILFCDPRILNFKRIRQVSIPKKGFVIFQLLVNL